MAPGVRTADRLIVLRSWPHQIPLTISSSAEVASLFRVDTELINRRYLG
jgi:hypothetical protein